MNGLSRKDLEEHEARIQAANDRVVSVLKDVAVQFNTIANQLMQLAKSNEDISSSLIERVYTPLLEAIKEHNDRTKELYAHSLEANRKDLAHLLEGNRKLIETLFTKLDAKIVGIDDKIDYIKQRQDAIEKETIKSRTVYIMIIGAITAAVGLAAAVIKLMGSGG